MKLRICIIIFLLTCRIVNAQDTLKYNKIIFKVAPLNFVDKFSFQTTQVGFEFRLLPKYSIDFSYGLVFGKEIYNHSTGKGFKVKSEIRRYNSNKSLKKHSSYFALEGFYGKVDYSASNTFENSIDSSLYEEDYLINKSVWGLNIKYGLTFNFLKRFLFDTYLGVGFRLKEVQHLNRTRPEDDFYNFEPKIENVRDEEGNYALPQMTLGFKIGYVIM